jgi:hypothetical protein
LARGEDYPGELGLVKHARRLGARTRLLPQEVLIPQLWNTSESGGMDRQTLRDWVHRFNERGPGGLKDSWSKGYPPTISSWRRSWIVWWEDEPASLTVKNQPVSYVAS